METEFCENIEALITRLDEQLGELSINHLKNIDDLNSSYVACVNLILQDKSNLMNLVNSFKVPDPLVYYPKAQELRNADPIDFSRELKQWKLGEVATDPLANFYKYSKIKKLEEWQAIGVEKCIHSIREVVITFCKRPHCKECLKAAIEANKKHCACNQKLSPRNVHEIMGFDYDVSPFIFT